MTDLNDPFRTASGQDAAPDEQTTSYEPPPAQHAPMSVVEPRTTWAAGSAGGWPSQTPAHWFEPLPGQEPHEDRRRSGSGLGALFVVAIVASVLGSVLTYAGLVATSQLSSPLGAVSTATPAPTFAPGSVAPPATTAPNDPDAISSAAARVSPAVVTITVREGEATDPFELPETGVGSGIIYDPSGWVLTNRHVVADATQVTVELTDGRRVPGRVYGVDTLTDLAIVKIDANDLPAAPIGDSSSLRPGQTAIVIGSPLGTFTNSVTSGVISALGRQLVVSDPVNGRAASPAQPDPDRRGDQPGQLGRTADR